MLGGSEAAPFEAVMQILGAGDEGQANELRALFLLADRGGATLTSRANVALYGFTNASLILPAVERLRRRGLTRKTEAGEWEIVDPFFAGWIRRQSPLALRQADVA
jgi:hypothetical protein